MWVPGYHGESRANHFRWAVYYVDMNTVQKRLLWLLVLIVLVIPVSWSFVDNYGQSMPNHECRAFKGVIVFADSKGFTDKRHVSVDMCGDR